MVLMILPLDENTLSTFLLFDNAICVIFLIDFVFNLIGSKPKRQYFIYQRGWLDLLGRSRVSGSSASPPSSGSPGSAAWPGSPGC